MTPSRRAGESCPSEASGHPGKATGRSGHSGPFSSIGGLGRFDPLKPFKPFKPFSRFHRPDALRSPFFRRLHAIGRLIVCGFVVAAGWAHAQLVDERQTSPPSVPGRANPATLAPPPPVTGAGVLQRQDVEAVGLRWRDRDGFRRQLRQREPAVPGLAADNGTSPRPRLTASEREALRRMLRELASAPTTAAPPAR